MIKLGIAGIGRHTELDIEQIQNHSEIEIVGIYDRRIEVAENAALKHNLVVYGNIDAMATACDTILVYESAKDYATIACILKNSKHLVISGFLLLNDDSLRDLQKTANEADVKILIARSGRGNLAFRKASVQFETLGFISIQHKMNLHTGLEDTLLIIRRMLPDIDMALASINSNTRKVSANGISLVGHTPDMIHTAIEFDNGSVANITASRIALQEEHRIDFYEPGRHLTIDFIGQTIDHSSIAFISQNQPEVLSNIQIETKSYSLDDSLGIVNELLALQIAINENTATFCGLIENNLVVNIANQLTDKMKRISNL